MFKTENQCKIPQVLGATDGTRHTGKRGLRTLERIQGPRTERRTLSQRILPKEDPITKKPKVGSINDDHKEGQERNENKVNNFQRMNLPLL